MSIPLDRLYNFLYDIINRDDIQIYRFLPHGSKKLEDLQSLYAKGLSWADEKLQLHVVCNDQEPLNYEFHKEYKLQYQIESQFDVFKEMSESLAVGKGCDRFSLTDYFILVHSELNSDEVNKYEKNYCIAVYYWCHAIIALDWFRYAKEDPAVKVRSKNINKDFLIYNRSWSGTREYRLKFSELLVESNLLDNCLTKFRPIDEVHYSQHQFVNKALQTTAQDLEKYFDNNYTLPSASADYEYNDYKATAIEVVLETIFDDHRIHLTEKVLRPIACKQPFMIASGPGCLDYLKHYGFKTFEPYINESYDSITDPLKRLEAIVAEMRRIASLSQDEKYKLYTKLTEIAEYNYQRFFSADFFNYVVNEFQNNFEKAIDILNTKPRGQRWIKMRKEFYKRYPESRSLLFESKIHNYNKNDVIRLLKWANASPKI